MSTIDKINYYLSKRGKNGAGLCEYLGVSSGVYSQWNTGRTSPRKSKLPMIAEYLGVTVSDLLPDEPAEREDTQQGTKKDPAQMDEVDAELVEIWNSADAADRRFLLETARMLKARRESK